MARNLQAVLARVNSMEKDQSVRLAAMENALNTMAHQLAHLQEKYNLLLTERFNGGSTAS